MSSRTTDDYERMANAGTAVIEPVLPGSRDQRRLLHRLLLEPGRLGENRASQFGILHYCAMGLNSKEANDEKLADEVLEILPQFALKEGVVAIGEIGYDEITPAEEKAYQWQLEFARQHDMVVMVHSPHRDKRRGIQRSLDVAKEIGVEMEKLVIDHNNEETVKDVLDMGAWAAFTIYPHTKMGSQRMVDLTKQYGAERFIVDSSCDWGVSDPLSVPKTAKMMLEHGVSASDVRLATYENAVKVYGYSGQIDMEALEKGPAIDQRKLFHDNSVLRGQDARVDEGVVN